MNARISEFLASLTKGSEIGNFFRKAFQKNLPLKPVLGLTGLAVVFIAFRPLFYGDNGKGETPEVESKQDRASAVKQKTLLLMEQKENELKKKEMERKALERQ